MALDIHKLYEKEGKVVLSFLDYCVRSHQLDPVFVYLTRDYRLAPTAAKAVGLYEIFCAPNGQARLSVTDVLPPLNLKLPGLLRSWLPATGGSPTPPAIQAPHPATPLSRVPPGYLFSSVVEAIQTRSLQWKRIRRNYRVRKTPVQNLPDGKMTAGQRHFVEKFWEPVLRPRLLAAGFWRIATVG